MSHQYTSIKHCLFIVVPYTWLRSRPKWLCNMLAGDLLLQAVCIAIGGLIPPSLYPAHQKDWKRIGKVFLLSLGNFFRPSWQDVKCFYSGEKRIQGKGRARNAGSMSPLDSGICFLLFLVLLTPELDPPFLRIRKHERKTSRE